VRVNERSGGHLSGKPELTRYARARRVGPLLFLAGVSSRQWDNSAKGASVGPAGTLELDIRALEREGLQLSSLVDVTVFLVNARRFSMRPSRRSALSTLIVLAAFGEEVASKMPRAPS